MATDNRTSSIEYPDSDGQPISDNTLQYEYITLIKGGLDILFADRPDVFVAGDLLWYPVEGDPKIRQGPDVLVAFGRPKGYRGSYRQWEEDNVPPQVVFEILSPGNRSSQMVRKSLFYERYGVEEYYVYDPDDVELVGWQRHDDRFTDIPDMQGWVSPRLGVRFEVQGGQLKLFGPDGRPFVDVVELARQRQQAEQQAQQERQHREQAEQQAKQAEQLAAEADRRAEAAETRARQQAERIQRLEAHLKAQGLQPPNGPEPPAQAS
jgi:Uma2 family endonuclease